jgi:hypothetical protein
VGIVFSSELKSKLNAFNESGEVEPEETDEDEDEEDEL